MLPPPQGLEVDPLTGYLLARPPSADWPRIAAEQEAWAAQVGGPLSVLGATPCLDPSCKTGCFPLVLPWSSWAALPLIHALSDCVVC
jgi:hypothetical protein